MNGSSGGGIAGRRSSLAGNVARRDRSEAGSHARGVAPADRSAVVPLRRLSYEAAMHATVVVFPGLNADAEMVHTLRDVVQVRTSVAWHRDAELPAGTPR